MNDLVFVAQDTVCANSREIAERFGKQHKHVLAAIDRLIEQAPELRPNFRPMIDDRAVGKGAVTRHRSFDMDRDGFSLLVMSFTGEAALRWKLAFIDAFNRMEATLRRETPAAAMDTAKLAAITAAVETAIKLGGESAGRRVWEHFGLPTLPVAPPMLPAEPGLLVLSARRGSPQAALIDARLRDRLCVAITILQQKRRIPFTRTDLIAEAGFPYNMNSFAWQEIDHVIRGLGFEYYAANGPGGSTLWKYRMMHF